MADKARQRAIAEWLSTKGFARLGELARQFGADEESIREDLLALEQEGSVYRTHEGALAADARETPHWQREFIAVAEKEALAREAIGLIEPGDCIVLDASSTAWYVARRLPEMPLTILTNSLHAAFAIAEKSHFQVLVAGGQLVSISMSLVGPEAQAFFRRHRARRLFMSCRGFDLETGATDASPEQALVRQAMLESAAERILLIDHSKLGFRAPTQIAPACGFDRIILDSGAEPKWFEALEQAGLRVQRAEVFKKPGSGL